MRKRGIAKKAASVLVAAAMVLGMCTISPADKAQKAEAATTKTTLSNPRWDSEGNVTYDCVWFGRYPQSDRTGKEKEPIKWRVLSVNGNDAFLVADCNLDVKQYNETWRRVTWETCTLRSWLNGYSADCNLDEVDYSTDNFIRTAFTATEKAAIKTTTVINNDNMKYETEGGNDTEDKIFLLSVEEVTNSAYGFSSDLNARDNARKRSTTQYTRGLGLVSGSASLIDSVDWWLRSPGCTKRDDISSATIITNTGEEYNGSSTHHVTFIDVGVCPALHLNLSATNVWSYAGTVCTDGRVDESGNQGGNPSESDTEKKAEEALNNAEALLNSSQSINSTVEIPGPKLSFLGRDFNLFKLDANINLDFLKYGNAQIKYNVGSNTVEIIIGVGKKLGTDDKEEEWKETYNDIKSLVDGCIGKNVDDKDLWDKFSKLRGKLQEFNADTIYSVSGNMAGYMRLQLNKKQEIVRVLEGGITAGLEGSASMRNNLFWVVYSEFGLSLGVDGKLSLTTDADKRLITKGEFGIEATPSMAIGADAVIADVQGGLAGTLGGNIQYPWISTKDSFSVYLSGKAFINVETIVPGLSGSMEFELGTVELYPSFGSIPETAALCSYERSELPDAAELMAFDADSANMVADTEDSLVYAYARPRLTQLPDGRIMMICLDDTVEGADGQAVLVYRIYQNGKWSTEKTIHAPNGVDTAGEIRSDGNETYVLYQSSSKPITEDMSIEAIAGCMNLYAARYNQTTDSFDEPVLLGEEGDNTWKYGYTLLSGDGLYAVWAENSSNDIMLEQGTTDICISRLTDGGWSEKEKILSMDKPITNIAFGVYKNKVSVSYIDGENVYIDGSIYTSDAKKIDYIKYIDGNIYARVDGVLSKYNGTGFDSMKVMCGTDYTVHNNKVYWKKNLNFNSAVYMQKTGSDAEPVLITEDDGYVGSYDMIDTADGSMLLYTYQQTDETADNPYGITVMKYLLDYKSYQAEITDAAYDELSFEAGTENDMYIEVQNTGTENLTNVGVEITDKNNNIIYSKKLFNNLASGRSRSINIAVPFPADFTGGTVNIRLTADETLDKASSYALKIEASNADIELTEQDNGKVVIKNLSKDKATGVVLRVADQFTGEEIKKITIGDLQGQQEKEVDISSYWKDIKPEENEGYRCMGLSITQNEAEFVLWNNSIQLVQEADISSITLDKSSIEMCVGDTYALKADVNPTNDTSLLQWESSDEAVATVDNNGCVTGISEGNAVITVTTSYKSDITAKCEVVIKKKDSDDKDQNDVTNKTNGIVKEKDGSYAYYKDGILQSKYTGIVKQGSISYYVKAGKVQTKFKGIVTYKKQKYYVKAGKVQTKFKGIVTYRKAKYYVKAGKVQTKFKGIVTYKKQKYYVKAGKVQTKFKGIVTYRKAKYYVKAGKVQTKFKGIVTYKKQKYYVKAGKVQTRFKGIVTYKKAQYYVKKGRVQTKYTGKVRFKGKTYRIVKGKVRR